MNPNSRSFSELSIGAVGLAAALLATLHCGASEDVSPPSASSVVGGGEDTADDGGPPDEDTGTTVVQSDGGTIDSGLPNTPFTVCGGSKGDPGAVPVLDWRVYTSGPKYEVLLGSTAPDDEPGFYSSTHVVASGERWDGTSSMSSAIAGQGPFGSQGGLTKSDFVENAMPETDLAFNQLGWSEQTASVFAVRTEFAQEGWKHYRVAGTAGHVRAGGWSLGFPKRNGVNTSEKSYTRRIVPAHGSGWFFTVVFDHECKANAFDALVGKNALGILKPPAGVTRAQVSKFLVENNARLFLTAATYGAEDPAIKAALVGTQASAATLDALDATMTAFAAAMKAHMSNLPQPTYESVTSGTNPTWVIGALGIDAVANLPPN